MANVVTIGMQWGDEGKGKIVDLLCPAYTAVVRFQGGHNAGHTVKFGDRHFSLHLIPSGIVHPGMRCVLGNGMVLTPEGFFAELERLAGAGVEAAGRLFVSDRIQILLPTHAALDQAREAALGKRAIGTTSRGIGPTYEGKCGRYGLRACDLCSPDFEARVEQLLAHQAKELAALGAEAPDRRAELDRCRHWAERLRPFLVDAPRLLGEWIAAGEGLLFEGAQGTFLDIDHGTYPYVTSSNTVAGAASTGAGVPPTALDGVIGVLKAYTTRVGGGPFVTELDDDTGEHLRSRGNEYGTTTGRPRRCGWLDTVAAARSRLLNGVSAIALTKLDILDDLEEVPVCVAYRIRGEETTAFPPDLASLEAAEPVYRVLPGWRQDTTGATELAELPRAARDYVSFIEEQVAAPVGLISTGPRREETILRADLPVLNELTSGRLDRVLRHRDGAGVGAG